MASGFSWSRRRASQPALPGLGEPRRQGPARYYNHAPACWLPLDERRGPFRVLGHPHRWWEPWQQTTIRRFLGLELELGERVAAQVWP